MLQSNASSIGHECQQQQCIRRSEYKKNEKLHDSFIIKLTEVKTEREEKKELQ